MQIIAMLTMLIDHIGYIFFPGDMTWRYIGRIAFPIYCYLIVQGHLHTSSRPKYLFRLFLIAMLSQVPYNLALDPAGINVVFTLLAGALLLAVLDKLPNVWLGLPLVAAVLWVMDVYPFDYNAYGLLLILIFRYAKSFWLVAAHLALNYVFLFYYGWSVQMLSIAATILIVAGPYMGSYLHKRIVPRWVWWMFYPGHLLGLAAVKFYVYGFPVGLQWDELLDMTRFFRFL